MENTEQDVSKQKLSPKFFFLSLGVLITLISSVSSFLILAFEALNKKFPDALNATYEYGYSSGSFEGIRSAMATLIIVFPVFLILSYLWNNTLKRGVGKIDEIIRKWMTYLILFLSSVVVIVDLVTLVNYFVSGEITTRFIYKVLITLIIAIFVGGYYVLQLMGRSKIFNISVNWGAGIKASIFVALLVWFSFCVIGSPREQRDLRFDQRRMQDLQSIQWQVINFWQQKEKIPEKIEDLSNPISSYAIPVDPEFEKGLKYEYIKKADLTFELCATFALPMPEGWQEYSYGGVQPMYFSEGKDMAVSTTYPYPGGGMNESWDHEAGRTCFERTIDPEIYPPYEKPDIAR